MTALGATPPVKTGADGQPCDCYDLNIRGAAHSGSCIRYADRYVGLVVDGAPCLITGNGSAAGMAAEVATGIGVPLGDVATVEVREDHARGGAFVTVRIFAPYTHEVTR